MSAGQIGYDAYKASTGGKTYDGRDMPSWEQVKERTPHVAKAWEDAARAIRASIAASASEPGARFLFSVALEHLKGGKRVARAGWSGKGMWIALTPGRTIDAHHFTAALLDGAVEQAATAVRIATAGKTGHLKILPRIDMRAADGSLVVGWLASQTDMLADDWMLVE